MIHTLEINGKKYPFKLGIRALMEYGQRFQGDAKKIDPAKLSGFDAQINLVWIGLKHGALRKGEEFKLTPEEVEDLFDTDMDGFLAAIEAINLSMPEGNAKRGAVKK